MITCLFFSLADVLEDEKRSCNYAQINSHEKTSLKGGKKLEMKLKDPDYTVIIMMKGIEERASSSAAHK